MFEYGYTYRRYQPTEAEIYQQAAAQAEASEDADIKAVVKDKDVNFYRDMQGEITLLCGKCASELSEAQLEYIDKAGQYDFCPECFAENKS